MSRIAFWYIIVVCMPYASLHCMEQPDIKDLIKHHPLRSKLWQISPCPQPERISSTDIGIIANGLAYDPHNEHKMLFYGASDCLYDSTTKTTRIFPNQESYTSDAVFDPINPNIIVTATGDHLNIWNCQDAIITRFNAPDKKPFTHLSCNPRKNLIASSDGEKTVSVWDLNAEEAVTWHTFEQYVTHITHLNESIIVVGLADGTIYFWDSNNQSVTQAPFRQNYGIPLIVGMASDGSEQVVVAYSDHLDLLHVAQNTLKRIKTSGVNTAVALHPNGKQLAVGILQKHHSGFSMVDLTNNRRHTTLKASRPVSRIETIAYNPHNPGQISLLEITGNVAQFNMDYLEKIDEWFENGIPSGTHTFPDGNTTELDPLFMRTVFNTLLMPIEQDNIEGLEELSSHVLQNHILPTMPPEAQEVIRRNIHFYE